MHHFFGRSIPRTLVTLHLLVFVGGTTARSHVPETDAPRQPSADTTTESRSSDDELEDLVGGLEAPGLGSELLLFADIPLVVSAGRNEQRLNLSPAPVSILTAEDIHFGGLTNIPEALRFVPGVDVLRSDRNSYGVGVRGFHHDWSERSLTLIDGRSAETPFQAVPEWLAIPLLMEDIERIEIVRGPGGAAWGANALNGVINIITKDPLQTQGVLLSSRLNEFGDTYSQARWGGASGKWSWRLSFAYEDHESADDAIDNDQFLSDDFGNTFVLNGKVVYQASEDDKFTIGLAYSGSRRGYVRDSGFSSIDTDEDLGVLLANVRWDHRFDDGGSAYLQWTGDYTDIDTPNIYHGRSLANGVDGQITFAPIGRHTISTGGSVRFTNIKLFIEDRYIDDEAFFPDGPLDEYTAGWFVQDRIVLAERLWLDIQLRLDESSATGTDWSGRVALLRALDKDERHVLRLAAARAFRELNPQFRSSSTPAVLVASEYVNNEGVWAVEAGYNGRLTDHLTFRVDGYYQRYSDLLGLVFDPPDFSVAGAARNLAGADAYGIEAELALKGEAGSISVWYAYHGYDNEEEYPNTRAYISPPHSVGLTGRLFFGDRFTLNANYRYDDLTYADVGAIPNVFQAVSPNHRLDLTLSAPVFDGAGELMIGVEDIFNTTQDASFELGGATKDTPGRTFFARVQFKF